jgi:hypothetical protein
MARANGARGYSERPASREELDAKFRACAARAIEREAIEQALDALHRLDDLPDMRVMPLLTRRRDGGWAVDRSHAS